MVYTAQELLAKLTYLQLVGMEEGYLQFMGKAEDWELADYVGAGGKAEDLGTDEADFSGSSNEDR